jgi:hypothetical protein
MKNIVIWPLWALRHAACLHNADVGNQTAFDGVELEKMEAKDRFSNRSSIH